MACLLPCSMDFSILELRKGHLEWQEHWPVIYDLNYIIVWWVCTVHNAGWICTCIQNWFIWWCRQICYLGGTRHMTLTRLVHDWWVWDAEHFWGALWYWQACTLAWWHVRGIIFSTGTNMTCYQRRWHVSRFVPIGEATGNGEGITTEG